jgi:hypothetical protein
LGVRPSKYLPLSNCVGACFLYTRRVLETVGRYDPAMRLAEDYDYWARVSKRFRMALLEEDLYLYRFHGESLTARRRPEVERMVDRVRQWHFAAGQILAAEALRASDRSDRAAARGLAARALVRRPLDVRVWRSLGLTTLPGPLVRLGVAVRRALRGGAKSIV